MLHLCKSYFIPQEQGLVIVGGDTSSSESCGEDDEDENKEKTPPRKEKHKRALVSADMANLLDSAGKGSLGMSSLLTALHHFY